MGEAHRGSSSDPMWPRLESWLTEVGVGARTRRETRPALPDLWMELAQSALNGDQAGLVNHLLQLREAQGDLIDAVTAQFEVILDVLSVSDLPPDPDLWRQVMACQSTILVEATRLATPPGQPSVSQLFTLIDFSREIVAILNPETLVEQVVSLMYRSFGYEYVHLFLMDTTGQQVVLSGGLWKGQPARPGDCRVLRVGDEEGIVGWVAAQGEPAVVPDVATDPRYKPHPALPDIRSEMSVPLKLGGRVLGVLDVQSDQANAFAEPDLFLLRALADQVAIAIENARLHVSMQRRLHEQTVLYETSAAISANLDADTVLQAIAAKLTEAAAVGGCVVCQWDLESDVLIPVAEYIVASAQNPSRTWRTVGEAMPLNDDPVASRVLQTNRPALLVRGRGEDTSLSPSWGSPGWKSLLALPLQLEGHLIGLVELYDRRASRRFSTDEVQLCQALAHQTAVALERIRLFDETRQRLSEVSELYTLANEFAANLNLTEVLDAIVRAIRRAFRCRGCCIFLLDETSQTLEIKAAAGLKPEWRDAAQLRLGEGVAGRAAAEARTVYLIDTLKDPEYIFFDREVRSLLAVPMQVKGRVIGVINVDERVPDAFGPDQERLLTIAAAQAAIAIENARLFSEMLSEKRRTDAIIRYMADGLLMLDRHKMVVSCNPALARMLGMRRQDILGQSVVAAEADSRLRAICEPATVKERTGVLAHEVEVPRAGSGDEALKPHRLRIFSTPVNDETGQPIGEVRVVHDVTKEREIEEMKDEFFSTISHELRTPLFSMQGFVRLLLDNEVPDVETQREFLGIIGRQAEQLGQLVSNLLNISQLESSMLEIEREPVQLLDVLQQTISKLRGMAQAKNIALEARLPTDLPPVTGDQGWLEQAATNLVGNAIKFTPEGGRVRISAQQSNGEVLVEVSDTGIGIPADALDRVFDKFYRVPHESDERSEGTGLGLHIARQIVELHDGRIWAESTVGEGSTFRFILPCG